MSDWKKVFATQEEAQQLSWGPWRGSYFPGVALPSSKARDKWVLLRFKDQYTCAQVADHGPWDVNDDDEYVFGSARPLAEIYKGKIIPGVPLPTLPDGTVVRQSNGAGIDLFPYVVDALKIPHGMNVMVEWKFIEADALERI